MNAHRLFLQLHVYPQIARGGQALPLKLKRGLALLAYLAVEARPVGRDALAALLWPDAASGVGRARLRRLVHEVHAVVGEPVVEGDADSLGLAPDVASDLARTRAAMAAADLAALSAPVAGELLAGFALDGSDAFDDWLGARRREQRAQVQRALERGVTDAAGRSDADADALDAAAAALLRSEPCSEAGHLARLHAAARRGDGAALESAYFEAAQRWREELGVKPSARIEAAYAAGRELLARSQSAVQIAFAPTAQGDVAHAVWSADDAQAPTILLMWGLMTNLEVGLDEPRVRALVERLARRHRVVMIDRRGMGLSERVGVSADAASACEDVCAVLDHLGLDRAWLFGSSAGGTMALDIALRRPDRVSGLLLYGTSASGRWSPATPWALHESAIDHWLDRLADPAHYDEGLRRFAPSAADDPHVQAWYARLLRNAASKGGVRALLQAFHATDLSARLAQVRVPTLVMQRRGDRVVPWEAGEQLARGIPGATLEALDGEDHFLWHGDRGAVLRAVERFVARHAGTQAQRLAA